MLHAEKVASERVFGREYDVWDVHTDKERRWVVTNPTNLYSQTLMPSLDHTLSFHIGLMARVAAHRGPDGTEAEQEFLLVTTRKLVQASEAFDQADERNSRLSACAAGNAFLLWSGRLSTEATLAKVPIFQKPQSPAGARICKSAERLEMFFFSHPARATARPPCHLEISLHLKGPCAYMN